MSSQDFHVTGFFQKIQLRDMEKKRQPPTEFRNLSVRFFPHFFWKITRFRDKKIFLVKGFYGVLQKKYFLKHGAKKTHSPLIKGIRRSYVLLKFDKNRINF